MDLDDLEVYQLSMELGDEVWEIVKDWDYFQRDTLGKQLIRAVDSIAANLSEGFGRYYFKENKQFCYYSRGSLYETRTFLTKAHRQNLPKVTQPSIVANRPVRLLTEMKSSGFQMTPGMVNDAKQSDGVAK